MILRQGMTNKIKMGFVEVFFLKYALLPWKDKSTGKTNITAADPPEHSCFKCCSASLISTQQLS